MFETLMNVETEDPTSMTITEVEVSQDVFEQHAFVAATYTTLQQKVLIYKINGNSWTYDQAVDLPPASSPQFADMELRADSKYLYVALPKSNKIGFIDLRLGQGFSYGDIDVQNPVDLALVPYFDPGKGQSTLIKDIINQTPDDAFDTPAARDLLLDKANQLEAEIEQPDVIDTVQDTMDLRTLVKERVVDETYQGFLISAIDNVLMMLIDRYLDHENPITYTTVIGTVASGLPSSAFDNLGYKNHLINKTNELEQKLTTDKYYLAMDRVTDIEQMVNDHVVDQEILPILDHIVSGIMNVITEIYQTFDQAKSINNSIYSLVESLDDSSFSNPGIQASILANSQQLSDMLTDKKLQQSLQKLTELESSISQHIIADETKNLLLQRTNEIRSLIEGL